jgi:hypothetical protein
MIFGLGSGAGGASPTTDFFTRSRPLYSCPLYSCPLYSCPLYSLYSEFKAAPPEALVATRNLRGETGSAMGPWAKNTRATAESRIRRVNYVLIHQKVTLHPQKPISSHVPVPRFPKMVGRVERIPRHRRMGIEGCGRYLFAISPSRRYSEGLAALGSDGPESASPC